MKVSSRIVVLVAVIALCLLTALGTLFFLSGWGVLVKVVFYAVSAAGIAAGITFFFLKRDALLKSAFILVLFAAFVWAGFAALSAVGKLNEYPSDEAKINRLVEMIRSAGSWGMAVYVFVQILQVVILPLPALVCYLPGVRIWGAGTATLLASAGVLTGSALCYALGRFVGKRAVIWIAGKENTEKYSAYIAGRGKFIFVLMQILPFFPDDILCLAAGLTAMNFAFFAAVMIIVRPAIIAMYCYFGSGALIPFHGWGIPVWIAIFAVCIALAVLSFKYQDKIEKKLVEIFTRRKTRPKTSEAEENASDEGDGATAKDAEIIVASGENVEKPPEPQKNTDKKP